MSKIVGRNDPCPCGSGLKYKKCCINKNIIKMPESYVDDEGIHFIGQGTSPTADELKKMETEYQKNIRNSPMWDEMVKKFGQEKAKELLKECKVKSR